MDYKKIGFKAGLEIHQQLATHKLFCNCQPILSEDFEYSFERYLRPTQSELGDVDRAALEEARRKRRFLYSASHKSCCLVEADEEPPHLANEDAIDTCLMVSLLLGAKPVDEIQFMRKIVIDGSNTAGFQRTALVATGGSLGDVEISLIAIEEDAARKLSEKGRQVNYGLDRLGIPLIEIATSASIKSPKQAREIAEEIGILLQATKKVKKGLGTIRQDLNVSISQGARVEIKGIQSLSSISRVAEKEVLRQLNLIKMKEILNKRAKKEELDRVKPVDLTHIFGSPAKGIRLPGFKGFLSAIEISAYAKASKNEIMHSDDKGEEMDKVKEILNLRENDAFVVALGKRANDILSLVIERARMFFDGVPEEVRRCLPDDTTEYMRPLPGAARMYPETDVPPVRITKERIKRLKLPEKPKEKHDRFISKYKINEEQARQLLSSGYEDWFERQVQCFPELKNVIIRTLLNTFPEIEKEGVNIDTITNDMLSKVFKGLCEGKYAKEGIPYILKYLALHPHDSLEEAIESCDLVPMHKEEILKIIKSIVKERKKFIRERGESALGPIMGIIMKELRGKVDGKVISRILEDEIAKIIRRP